MQRDQLFYGRKVDVQDIPVQSHFPYIGPGVGNARLGHPFMDGCQLVRRYHDVQMDIPLAVLHQRSSSRPFRRCSNNLNQVAIHAHTYGVYPEEIDGLKRDYEKLWGEVSKVLREFSELIRK